MFWRREKTVRVELVNPEIRMQAVQRPEPKPEAIRAAPSAQAQSEGSDFIFKLIALVVVAAQSTLAIYGYSALTGHYETFGISMSELEVGLPTLLFQGYLFLFMDTALPAFQVPLVGPSLIALAFMSIAAWVVWRFKSTSSFEEKLWATAVLGFLLYVLFVMPLFASDSGRKIALVDIGRSGLPTSPSHLSRTHVIPIGKDEKQGMLITATTKYTFLLVGTEVLKIDNDGNKVVRVTRLSTKSDPADATKP